MMVRIGTVLCGLLLLALSACNLPSTGPTAQPSAAPTATLPPATQPATATEPTVVEIQVYFTDEPAYNQGTPPFERAVTRTVPADTNLPEAVLTEFFKGPTPEEAANGLALVASGFTGLDRLDIVDGVAHVYLTGDCASNGATYTIAQPLMANLLQFETIRAVKIYDADGVTEQPEGDSNSIPFCLEP